MGSFGGDSGQQDMGQDMDADTPAPELNGLVPALTKAFQSAELAAHVARAEAWCQEQGAAYLAEVHEALEDMAASLGLATQERQRLRVALQGYLSGGVQHTDNVIFKQPTEAQKSSGVASVFN